MTKVDTRRDVLTRALEASVTGDALTAMEIYTTDVRAWSPAYDARSREDLVAAEFTRFGALSDVEIDAHVDVIGERAYAEWTLVATHSGAVTIDDTVVAPSGRRVTLRGITVAEFRGERIAALRQYWDEVELIAGLGLIAGD
jgi:ketosteroid isomerase-like protein